MPRGYPAISLRDTLHIGGLLASTLIALALPFGCTSSGSTTSSGTAASSTGDVLCIPGAQVACACPAGAEGVQVCNELGSGYAPCQCPTTGSGGSGGNAAGAGGSGGMVSGSGGGLPTGSGGGGGMASGSGGSGGMVSGSGGGLPTGSGGSGGMPSGSGGAGGAAPMATCRLPAECANSVPIPTTQSSMGGIFLTTVCMGGPNPTSNPPKCILETDLAGIMAGMAMPNTCGVVSLSGIVKLRLQSLPMRTSFGGMSYDYYAQVGGTCGMPAWVDIPVQITGDSVASPEGMVRFGCEPIAITSISLDEMALADATTICNGGSLSSIINALKDLVRSQIASQAEQLLLVVNRGRACLDVPMGAMPMPAPCLQTPCEVGAACTATVDCSMGSACTCGTCK